MNALDQLLEQGREEGHRRGRDEERREIARRMLAMGMTTAQVAEAALLDESAVRSLLAETPDGPIGT